MAEVEALRTTIENLLARAAAGERGRAFVQHIEDVLFEGYAQALQLDARRQRLDAELEDLVSRPTDVEAMTRLRRLASEARTQEAHAYELRARLAILREHFVALGGTRVS